MGARESARRRRGEEVEAYHALVACIFCVLGLRKRSTFGRPRFSLQLGRSPLLGRHAEFFMSARFPLPVLFLAGRGAVGHEAAPRASQEFRVVVAFLSAAVGALADGRRGGS